MAYDREKDLKAFDDSKAGVKGLVDAGLTNLPRIFVRPPDELAEELNTCPTDSEIPLIDLSGVENGDRRKEIVLEVQKASESWGFFQLVNHGIPSSVLDAVIDGVRGFHEQDVEVKKMFYTRDRIKKVRFDSNLDLYRSRAANWRDTLTISMPSSDTPDPNEVPEVCRAAVMDYIKLVKELGETLFELLSDALGLTWEHFRSLECTKGRTLACHYYPACPEPELTLGASKHTDPAFLTILLQDQLGALQVLHENHWVNIKPIPGGLLVNIGDLLQILSNDKFKSVDHRVLANRVGPRISAACFFIGDVAPSKIYGPVKELTSEENPPLYSDFTVTDYIGKFLSGALDDKSGLDHFRI